MARLTELERRREPARAGPGRAPEAAVDHAPPERPAPNPDQFEPGRRISAAVLRRALGSQPNGAVVARALRESLRVAPDVLTLDAVTWLQSNAGQMKGHVARYQRVLTAHLQGAELLDANFDGKLDPNDLAFLPSADGAR